MTKYKFDATSMPEEDSWELALVDRALSGVIFVGTATFTAMVLCILDSIGDAVSMLP